MSRVVTTFFAVSRAHLRRAGPDGPSREQRGRARAAERERAARVTRRKRPGFNLGVSPLRGGSFAASFGREPYGAAAAAHSIPGDRPPAVPAVSRCRARQHHGQTVVLVPGAPEAVKLSQRQGRSAAHCPGWPLQPQRCFASRCAGRACGAPLTLETSASPAGLTARARPEARPETRAARPRQLTKGREKRSLHHRRSAIDLIVPLVRQSSLLAA